MGRAATPAFLIALVGRKLLEHSLGGSRSDFRDPGSCTGARARVLSAPRRPFQVHVNVLLLCEADEFLDAFLAAHPRLLIAAEGRAEEMARDLVDPDEAGLNRSREAVSLAHVVGPDRTCEAIFNPVHLAQHLALVLPPEDGEHGSENLLPGDPHCGGHVREDGGLDEVTLSERRIVGALATGEEARALADAGIDITHDAVELRLADDRSHGGLGVDREPRLEGLDPGCDPFEHRLVDVLMDEGPAR